ncbi:hypothetical protein SPF06_00050 [Sinomonas sp. JGH33]|uniref:Histidine kinase n=1 Tax=Sinomonas terricola TaxID=3110330 RepID=A0ABU5T0B9_9MICC|nr:hypothetical protein [Sinomonas sp. JGH33]MEA5453099.1 hypothetical protein [Sinomonas sp. JGH33]
MQSSTPSGPLRGKPVQLAVLVGIVLIEAIALLAFAVFYAAAIASGQAEVSPAGAAFTMVLLAVFGAGVGAAGFFLWRGYRWARSVVLVVQLFAATIGFPALTGGSIGYGLLILVPAAGAVVLLFSKRVFAVTQRSARETPPE